MIANDALQTIINSPVRQITAKVELYNGSTLAATYAHNDALVSISIERVADKGKFFGFGVCQKINVKLRDFERRINITTAHSLKVYFNNVITCPPFYVTEVHRDENTNELSITAYDGIYKASAHTFSELGLEAPYTIVQILAACKTILGLNYAVFPSNDIWTYSYEEGANLEGTETLREVLDAIAEATQTIYYINTSNNTVFKRLDSSGAAVLTIDKDRYFSLESGTNRRLATICHATELGDNVSASTAESGSTQYVRDNPFWDLREDIADLVNSALAAVGGLTINQFECEWRGNPLLEIGDKIALTTKNNGTVISYVLDDVIDYDGSLSQQTRWSYEDDDAESADNPTSLGDALKQTYARVDKANKQIDLVAGNVDSNSEAISALQLTTDGISASVTNIEQTTTEAIEGVNSDIATLTSKVEATMSAEDVRLEIKSELANGVDKVTTSTGFTFNEEGLTVSKTGSEMSTTITEDGMTVYKDSEAVLIADNEGVMAEDLHATTYLIIGTNSRFENYGNDRTGCFWIGG